MQTLSRYFVAFLLVLVTNFIGDSDAKNENQQAYQPQFEVQEAPVDQIILKERSTRCS